MVATAAQLAANRANARRSTGPRTPEGKAASSHNALAHGAYASDDTILATAPSTYLEDFRAHFQPACPLEEHLVAHLVVLAARRDRLAAAMDALLELDERHALLEHLHERYGVNADNAYIDGQPSWLAAMRRYDGNTYVDDRFPEPVSNPDLDPDPILCSLAYTLSGPRAAALFRHEASVDRRFSATFKQLAVLQAERRAQPTETTSRPFAAPSGAGAAGPDLSGAAHTRSAAATPGAAVDRIGHTATRAAALDVLGGTDTAMAPDPQPDADGAVAAIPPRPETSPAPGSGLRDAISRYLRATATPDEPWYEPNEPAAPDEHAPAQTPRVPDARPDVPSGATSPDRGIEANAGPRRRRAAAAPRPSLPDRQIKPNPAALLPDDEPSTFLSVLPRHPHERSSIPAHWPSDA
jgi:hypothetical protein